MELKYCISWYHEIGQELRTKMSLFISEGWIL